ncbi:MAG: caspase family protein [Acetobacterales bacterium]
MIRGRNRRALRLPSNGAVRAFAGKAFAIMALALALSAPAPAVGQTPPGADAADRFLVVDCMLPGQVRRLGTRTTYVTARRPLKTTASECAIRGGEYTADDRASYASSLRAWLPLANEGDPLAQTYVGEIYEKGLGVPPQYDLAAQWYAKAAGQGSSRAQLSLGALYERGLGVPLDPARAAELFAEASGLSGAAVPFVPATQGPSAAEMDLLREERDRLAAERDKLAGERDRLAADRDRLSRELDAARNELRESERRIERSSVETERARQAFAATRQELERAVTAGQQEAVLKASARLAERSRELEQRELELSALRKQLREAEDRAAATRRDMAARLAEREQALERYKSEAEAAKAELGVVTRQLDEATPRGGSVVEAGRPATPSGIDGIDFGRFHALVIGNNDYRFLPRLKSAAGDARAVARLLEDRYGFKVTLLLDADRYAILSALNKLRETLNEQDNLLIYYAGHGELDRVNNRGHWLPVDAEPDSTANWISNIQITDILNAMAVRQVLVVADSCYSGTLTRASMAQLDAGMSEDLRLNWIRTMAEKRARVVLTSGGIQPVLDSGGGQHSVFARAFLEALRRNDGVLEGQELSRIVAQMVAASGAAQRLDQVPEYAPIRFAGHEAGDFFFVPKVI